MISLVAWTIVLVVSVKYVAYVMRADNQREGGIMALVALVRELPVKDRRIKAILVAIGIIGVALFFGDGTVTPAISVISSVEGLRMAVSGVTSLVVPITVALLTLLFAYQALYADLGQFDRPSIRRAWFFVVFPAPLINYLGQGALILADPTPVATRSSADAEVGASADGGSGRAGHRDRLRELVTGDRAARPSALSSPADATSRERSHWIRSVEQAYRRRRNSSRLTHAVLRILPKVPGLIGRLPWTGTRLECPCVGARGGCRECAWRTSRAAPATRLRTMSRSPTPTTMRSKRCRPIEMQPDPGSPTQNQQARRSRSASKISR